ncbi:hypothetical protein C9374_002516 [Naegleria lovaniensis]|uniref:Uncharacterized protein n=1 Tax=Naegleria lovaniensis TaxID=51637 RepID=A0AA88KQU2_NAELO|nr:uncharacterized protein C9374_002516 [Naegleria lovaniensis]KAG2386772.1 hypothetical protein C9374_002516 [Naegleria lovaniensis]
MHQTSMTLQLPYSENPKIIIERSPNSGSIGSSGGGGGGGSGGHKSPLRTSMYPHSPLVIERPKSPVASFSSPKYHHFHKSPDIANAAATNFVSHYIPHHADDECQELEDYLEDEYILLRPCLRNPTLLMLPTSFKNKKKLNNVSNRNKRVLTLSTSPKLSVVVPPLRSNNMQF